MKNKKHPIATNTQVDAFLRKVDDAPLPVAAGKQSRLIFAMDATASREPTWDRACKIQGQLFKTTDALGGIEIQLVYYGGFGDLYASPWFRTSKQLLESMSKVRCLGGATQIGRVLSHALRQSREQKIDALIFVGDCMEENADPLCKLAGELGMMGVPIFMFQEGHDIKAASTFAQIAALSGGAHCQFDSASADQLRTLLGAVAAYAAGGLNALEKLGAEGSQLLKLLGGKEGNT